MEVVLRADNNYFAVNFSRFLFYFLGLTGTAYYFDGRIIQIRLFFVNLTPKTKQHKL